MRILGIDTSCDDTAAAVVDDGPRIVSDVIFSQYESHAPFGGVVPEVASREHVAKITQMVEQAVSAAGDWNSIEGLAVTRGPGLVGSLLVGLQFTKGLALARRLPWIGINHLEGHLCAALLSATPINYPHIALVVSGGHTQLYYVAAFGKYRVLGGTRDDAAGEAFDKVAKILGLGYPGGQRIDQSAQGGDRTAIRFPRSLAGTENWDFSFSGLKTSAAQFISLHGVPTGAALTDFCASFQEAIADILTKKAVAAAKKLGVAGVVLAGGVAANSRLRELLDERCTKKGLWAFAPPKRLCTDNAAMVAAAGWHRLSAGEKSPFDTSALSRWPLGEQSEISGRVKSWRN